MLRRFAPLLLLAALTLAAAPPPAKLAPDTLDHGNAIFLKDLSNDGRTRVQFRASAYGSYFFFEEPAGVTVYLYDGKGYTKVEFLKGATLAKATKKYPPTK